jgi:hypothetical protein
MSRSSALPIPTPRRSAAILALFAASGLSAATITVNTTTDLGPADDGVCELREAVTAANSDAASGASPGECPAGSGDDVIAFDLALPATIALNFGELALTENATVAGPGAGALTISAQGFSRVFVLWQPSLVDLRAYELSGLRLTGGLALAAYQGFGANDGGAILAKFATLTLRDLVFEDNFAQDAGGAIFWEGDDATATVERSIFRRNHATNVVLTGGGGAIAADGGNLTVRDSLFEANAAEGDDAAFPSGDADGGAISIWATGSLVVERSTFSGNTARGAGGAIAIGSFGATTYDVPGTIRHSTFVGNQADTDGDGDRDGGGIRVFDNLATTTLTNSLVAGNADQAAIPAPDIAGAGLLSGGHDLIGVRRGTAAANFPAGLPNANGDWVGSNATPLDAGVLPLADNGGPTPTVALDLAAASPAIDHGSCPGELADQRGCLNPSTLARPVDEPTIADTGDGCDIGAFELGALAPALFADDFESGDTSIWSSTFP